MNTSEMAILESQALQLQPIIAREPYSDALIEELKPLLHEHWLEVATFRDQIPLDPDFALYRQLDAKGRILCLTARVAGELIGYSVFVNRYPPHYRGTLSGINDVIWVHPAYRLGRVGLRLIRESESHAREMGVKKLIWHAKPDTTLHQLLVRLGYVLDEVLLARLL